MPDVFAWALFLVGGILWIVSGVRYRCAQDLLVEVREADARLDRKRAELRDALVAELLGGVPPLDRRDA